MNNHNLNEDILEWAMKEFSGNDTREEFEAHLNELSQINDNINLSEALEDMPDFKGEIKYADE
jgi:hypothetical protein